MGIGTAKGKEAENFPSERQYLLGNFWSVEIQASFYTFQCFFSITFTARELAANGGIPIKARTTFRDEPVEARMSG